MLVRRNNRAPLRRAVGELPRIQADIISFFLLGAFAVLPLSLDLSPHQRAPRASTVNKRLTKNAVPYLPVAIGHLT
jgi:hypothetical protein